MKRSVDQQIAEATNKLQRLKTKKRTRDTRLKIVVGATLIAEARANPKAAGILVEALQARITRDVDKREVAALIKELTNSLEGTSPND